MDASKADTYNRMDSASSSGNQDTTVQATTKPKKTRCSRGKKRCHMRRSCRGSGAEGQCPVAKFKRNHGRKVSKCMRFPWLSVSLVLATIWAGFKMCRPSSKVQNELRSLFTEDHHIALKGPIYRGFIGLVIVNIAVLVMSFKANGFCQCPRKRRCGNNNSPQHGHRCCNKMVIKWALHWVALIAAYTLAVCAFVSVVGGAIAVVLTAASHGVCSSGLTDLTSIVNTVLAAFREWICTMEMNDSDSSDSSDSYDWGRHKHESMCEEIPMSFTQQEVTDWCTTADKIWMPAAYLVSIGACLVVIQFTVAIAQRANLVAFYKTMEAECKKACANQNAVEITDVPAETTTPGGEVTKTTIAV